MRICLRFDSLSLLQVVADVVLTSLNASTSTWQPFRFQPSIPTPAPVLPALPCPAPRPPKSRCFEPALFCRALTSPSRWLTVRFTRDGWLRIATPSGANGRAPALGSYGRAAHQHRLADSDVAPAGAL